MKVCSEHPCCQGPHLRPDHDQICNAGASCGDEACWQGCRYCVALDSASGLYVDDAGNKYSLAGSGWDETLIPFQWPLRC
jgi:hypothetical protein